MCRLGSPRPRSDLLGFGPSTNPAHKSTHQPTIWPGELLHSRPQFSYPSPKLPLGFYPEPSAHTLVGYGQCILVPFVQTLNGGFVVDILSIHIIGGNYDTVRHETLKMRGTCMRKAFYTHYKQLIDKGLVL